MEIGGLKVAPDGSKSYARPIKLDPAGGAGGFAGNTLIWLKGVPSAFKPTVPAGMDKLT
jgi:hypothetical protein